MQHTCTCRKAHCKEPNLITTLLYVRTYIQFSTTFVVEYHFEDIQNLQFCVYDVDDKRRVDDVSKHDFIGSLECTVADIVSAGQEYTRTIRAQGTYMYLHLHGPGSQ